MGSSRYVWLTVFGSADETKAGPASFRNPTAAMNILFEIVKDNPSGQDGKRKVRKFQVNLGKYEHNKMVFPNQVHISGL